MRINRHSGIGLNYPPFVHAFIYTLSSSSQNSLPLVVMEGVDQSPPTQEAQPSKLKSKKTTSSASQKTGVVKLSKSKLVGRVKVSGKGEGTVDRQGTQKDKVSEGEKNHHSHSMFSQKGTYVNKESNTSFLPPSQKGGNIEKSHPPMTQDRAWTQTNNSNLNFSKEERKANQVGH